MRATGGTIKWAAPLGLIGLLGLIYSSGCLERDEDRAFECQIDDECGAGWSCDFIRNVCVDEKLPIRLGMTGSMTGMAGEIGVALRIGIEAAFYHHNQNGGINGREIVLDARDDAYNPDLALENVIELLDVANPTHVDLEINPDPEPDPMGDDRVFAFIGNTGTATAIAGYQYASKQEVILFAPMTGTSALRPKESDVPKEWLFHLRASYGDEAAKLVDHFVEGKKIATENLWVFCQSDGFGQDGLDGVVAALGFESEAEMAVVEKYDKTNYDESVAEIAGRFQERLTQAAAASSANDKLKIGIIMADAGGAGIKFLQEVRGWLMTNAEVNDKLDVTFGRLSIANKTLADGLATQSELYDGLISTQVVPLYNQDANALRLYRERLKAYCDAHSCDGNPSFTSLEGYLAGEVFAQALKLHAAAKKPWTSVAFKETLEGMRGNDKVNLDLCDTSDCFVSFSELDHQGLDKVWLTLLERKKDESTGTWAPVFKSIED